MRIRRFQETDARKVVNIIRRALLEVNSRDYPLSMLKAMCKRFTPTSIKEKAKTGHTYVAVESNEVVGTARLKENTISTLFILPTKMGRGIGRRLMEQVEKKAKEDGYSFIQVPSSLTAVSFYRKMGYKKVKEVYSKEYGKNIIMKKILILDS